VLRGCPVTVYRLCLFILNKIYLGSPCILIGLKVLTSSFRSLEPPITNALSIILRLLKEELGEASWLI